MHTEEPRTQPKKLGLKEGRINPTTERIQKAVILGTVKICKTVLNM